VYIHRDHSPTPRCSGRRFPPAPLIPPQVHRALPPPPAFPFPPWPGAKPPRPPSIPARILSIVEYRLTETRRPAGGGGRALPPPGWRTPPACVNFARLHANELSGAETRGPPRKTWPPRWRGKSCRIVFDQSGERPSPPSPGHAFPATGVRSTDTRPRLPSALKHVVVPLIGNGTPQATTHFLSSPAMSLPGINTMSPGPTKPHHQPSQTDTPPPRGNCPPSYLG